MKLPSQKYIDKPFWALYLGLVGCAILALFSASSTLAYEEGSALGPILKQIFFIILGGVSAFFIQYLDSKWIRQGGKLIYWGSVLCLYLIIIPGSPFGVEINGAGRWFRLFGFQFQPSELAKLGLIIVVADILANAKTDEEKKIAFFKTLGYTLLVCLPILVGNLSTTILIGLIVLALWFLAKINWRYILATIGICIVTALAGYCIVKYGYLERGKKPTGLLKRSETWVNRVDNLFEEHQESAAEFRLTDENRQRSLAKVAVVRGGIAGVMPGNSQERDFLPLAYADYIFAIIVEETGLIGAILLCFIYLAISIRACMASTKYGDYNATLIVMGLALMLTTQAFISMAVAVGLGPVTGQPLPMVSKGGTSVVFTSMYFGIMMCVAREQNKLKDKQGEADKQALDDTPILDIETTQDV